MVQPHVRSHVGDSAVVGNCVPALVCWLWPNGLHRELDLALS
jgi:hypothetical protein